MSRAGYVLIHRKVLKSDDIGKKPMRLAALVQMVGAANHDDRTIQWNGQPRVCQRGSFVLSLKGFAEDIGMHRVTFKKHLDYLIKRNTVKLEKAREGCMITFQNYDEYQDITLVLLKTRAKIDTEIDSGIDTAIDSTSDSGMAPNKEQKELKKQKNIKGRVFFLADELKESFETFINAYPLIDGRTQAEKTWSKIKPPITDVLNAIEKYKATKPEWQNWKMPSTFLNCYKDYLRPDHGKTETPKPMSAFLKHMREKGVS